MTYLLAILGILVAAGICACVEAYLRRDDDT